MEPPGVRPRTTPPRLLHTSIDEPAWDSFGEVLVVLIPNNRKPAFADADPVDPRMSQPGWNTPSTRGSSPTLPRQITAPQGPTRASDAIRARKLLGRGVLRRPCRRLASRVLVPPAGR